MGAMVKLQPAFRITSCDGWPPLYAMARQCLRHAFTALFCFAVLFSSAPAAEKIKGTASADQVALITRATERELHALEHPTPFQFQDRLEWNWGTETRSVIETPQGRADRIVLLRDEPLTPEQQEKQTHRLEKLLSDRDAVKGELQDQNAEIQRRIRMVQAFPRAFFFDFIGREKGLLHFGFYPNPEFSPKDRETQMYRGMEGSLWIDPAQECMVQIEGKLVKDVSFGWGILGRLSKGGIFEIAQTQLTPGTWRITRLNVDVKGRILLLDSFRYVRRETDTHLRPTPASTTYQSAVTALLAAPAVSDWDKPAGPPAPPSSRKHQSSSH
jgi:hypothetical protein